MCVDEGFSRVDIVELEAVRERGAREQPEWYTIAYSDHELGASARSRVSTRPMIVVSPKRVGK